MKRALKRIVALALIFSMTIPGTIIAASAETITDNLNGAAVVRMTNNKDDSEATYDSFSAALNAAEEYSKENNFKRYTITLLEDTAEDIVIPAGKHVTIDLNGHTVTNVSSHTITNNSKYAFVADTSAEKTGAVDNVTHGKGAVYNNINSTITLNGGTFMRSHEAGKGENDNGGNSWYVIKNFGTMTINSGVNVKFSDSNPGLYSSLIGNGWQDAAKAEAGNSSEPKPSDGGNNASLTIKGGNLLGGQITIKNDDYGILKITGGTITQPSNDRSAIANNNEATISGGEIKTTGSGAPAIYSRYFDTNGANKGTMTISGGVIESTGTVVQTQAGTTLNVKGGTLSTTGRDSYAVEMADTAKVVISGGTFENIGADRVANMEEAFDGKYEPVEGADGNIHIGVTDEATEAVVIDADGNREKYLSFGAATKAASAGSTVKLMKDVTLTSTAQTVNYGVTVDLNGHNVDGTAVTSANGVIKLGTNYSSKPVDGMDNTIRLINSQNTGGEVKGNLPVTAKSGNSSIALPVKISDSVILTAVSGGDSVKLGSSAYLMYSDKTAGYFNNGTFKVTDENGQDRIYGQYGPAVKNAANGIVTLLHDYTGNETISSGSSTGILDLNDKTYTYTGSGEIVDVNYPNVGLTIKNGTLTATDTDCIGIMMIGASNKEQMDNRSITLENVEMNIPGQTYGIITNGTEKDNTIVLRNSTLNVNEGYGIYFPSTGSVTIDNSVINAKYTGVQICAGSLTVTGNETAINVTGQPQPKTEGDGVIADGAAISIIERDGYQDLGTVNIEDGTFVAENADAVKAYSFNNQDKTEDEWADAGKVIDISGGIFSSQVEQDLCADEYVPAVYDENTGMYTVVKDTAAPVIKASGTDTVLSDGGTYYGGKLQFTVDDLSLASVMVNNTAVQPDQNGVYTISGAGEYAIAAVDAVGNRIEVVVTLVAEKGTISEETAEITLTNKLIANGKEQTQIVKVVVGGVTLTEGVDYQVTGNKATEAGEYTLTVTGIGNYEGSIQVKYTVAKASTEDPGQPGTDPGDTGDGDQGQNESDVSKTGDDSNIVLLLFIMAIAAASGVAFFIKRKQD